MRVVFHIISTGGSGCTSRATRYISERDKDPTREGPGDRLLFSEDRDDLTYRKADRILDPVDGEPQKEDLIHLSVSFKEEDFDKLGRDEKEKQERLREVIREGMNGMADELKVEGLTWVSGIHRNTDNPHAHIVMRNGAVQHGEIVERQFGRLRTSLLPHKQTVDGKETIVPGRIGDRFLTALDKQQELFLNPDQSRTQARDFWERMERAAGNRTQARVDAERSIEGSTRDDRLTGRFKTRRHPAAQSIDSQSIAQSWNREASARGESNTDYRLALGRHLEFSTRLAFAEIWHERAVKHGDTYRFEVVDQSTGEERKISELDVHRRAAARAQRIQTNDRGVKEQAYQADLSQHRQTLDQLLEVREAKIAALGKDVGSLRGTVAKVEEGLAKRETPSEKRLTPLLSRETLSELQETAVRLNLPEKVSELETLRRELAHEFKSPTRTEDEAAKLVAQANVARADLMAKTTRLENFEAAVHLTPYEVHGERWSLGALDKQIARRREDSKFVPERAMRLDLRSLARLNYSTADRELAVAEVDHLAFIRGEIVRQIKQRREPMISDRDRARDMVEVLDEAYDREERSFKRQHKDMQDPRYEPYQMKSLETSAEILRDPTLLREVHDWEKHVSKNEPEINWQGRAVAREIISGIVVEETKERLQRFLESKRVAPLNLGDHRTGTMREVEARTLTEYLARAIESREQRDHRHSINLAARDHHGRLVGDFQKARDYHDAARELASDAQVHDPRFTDKEKINLEIYAERQNDEFEQQRYLQLARDESASADRSVSLSQTR
jgi:hypothetical protein